LSFGQVTEAGFLELAKGASGESSRMNCPLSDKVCGYASEKVGAQYQLRHWRRKNRQNCQSRTKKCMRLQKNSKLSFPEGIDEWRACQSNC
jgi:hypothetical protein